MTARADLPAALLAGLTGGDVIPYLGPDVLGLVPGGPPVPATPEALAAFLAERVSVPHKIRKRLTAVAQFIENFKHRKTLTGLLDAAFAAKVPPTPLHRYLASLSPLPLIVAAWYDDAMRSALAARKDWGQAQGLAQSEHFGTWVGYYDAAGTPVSEAASEHWDTLLYQPIGSAAPAGNFLASDSDYVEVLTEIDIQTPIPQRVKALRAGRHFLFLGCRFNDQLTRTFARQIMKRSSDRHWAILEGELTRNEARFLAEQRIERIDLPLSAFVGALMQEAAEVHV
jgi:hypothetical protein